MMKRSCGLSLALPSQVPRDTDRASTFLEIADHDGINPVGVRWVLGKLRQAGLQTSERGHSGGLRLARSSCEATWAEVYFALEDCLGAARSDVKSQSCHLSGIWRDG